MRALCLLLGLNLALPKAQANTDLFNLSLEDLLATPVTVTSRFDESISDTPATVRVIQQQEIQQRHYRNLLDVLQNLPGFDVQHAADSGNYNNVTVNGLLSSNKLLIFRDGIRIDAPLGDRIPVDNNFSLNGVDRVEIAYGPAAAVYGADAQGGVINLVSRTPGKKTELTIGLSGGQFDQRRVNFWVGKSGQDWSFSFNAQQDANDNADLSTEYPEVYPTVGARDFAGNIVIPASSREPFHQPTRSNSQNLRLTWHMSEFGWDRWHFRQQSSVSTRPDRTLFLDESRYTQDLNSLWFRQKWVVNDKTDARFTVQRSYYQIDPESRYDNVFSSFMPAYKYATSQKDRFELQFDHKTGDTGQTRISGGLSYEKNHAIPRTPDLPQPYDRNRDTNDQGQTYPNTTLPITIFDVHDFNYSSYLQWSQPWSPQWRSVAGLRFDKHSRYGTGLTPRMGVIWQPSRDELFKWMFGKAFRAPAIFESYSSFGSFNGSQDSNGNYLGSNFRAPNPELRPEHLIGHEISWRKQHSNRWETGLRGYYYALSNMIAVRTDPVPQQYINGAILSSTSSYGNLEHGQSYGVDFDSHNRLTLADRATDIWLAYSLAYGDMTRSNGQTIAMPFLARHKLKLGAAIQLNEQWQFNPSWQLISGTLNNYVGPQAQRQGAPGYGVVDLNIQRSFDGGMALIRIDNLLNHHYGNAGFESGGNTTLPSVPQSPRALNLELRLDW